jgi:hypothetical protein
VVLAANAVQAAPAGLAVTISTAAALAGTTIPKCRRGMETQRIGTMNQATAAIMSNVGRTNIPPNKLLPYCARSTMELR